MRTSGWFPLAPPGLELSAAWTGEGSARGRIRRKFQEHGEADSQIGLLFSRLTFAVIGEEVSPMTVRTGMPGTWGWSCTHGVGGSRKQSGQGAVIPLTAFQDRLEQEMQPGLRRKAETDPPGQRPPPPAGRRTGARRRAA